MAGKVVSQLNASRVFVCPVVADESPLEPGVFLIPGGAVDLPPPAVPDGHVARFDGKKFVIEPIPASTQPEPPPMTAEEIQKQYERAVQAHMDAAAKAAGYDNLLLAVTYAEEPAVEKFQAEGRAFRAWRSMCWAYFYAQMDLVLSGQRERPTIEQLLAELPKLAA